MKKALNHTLYQFRAVAVSDFFWGGTVKYVFVASCEPVCIVYHIKIHACCRHVLSCRHFSDMICFGWAPILSWHACFVFLSTEITWADAVHIRTERNTCYYSIKNPVKTHPQLLQLLTHLTCVIICLLLSPYCRRLSSQQTSSTGTCSFLTRLSQARLWTSPSRVWGSRYSIQATAVYTSNTWDTKKNM